MTTLPIRHYCIIEDPVIRDEEGELVIDDNGQTTNQYGETEIRFQEDYRAPFPLYHGERIKQAPTLPTTLHQDESLRIKAVRSYDK